MITTVAVKKLDDKLLFVAFGTDLDQSQLEISATSVFSFIQSVINLQGGEKTSFDSIQSIKNSFKPKTSPLYEEMYQPSDQEVEVKQETKTIVTKEQFTVLNFELPKDFPKD